MSEIKQNLRVIDYIRERSNLNWDCKFTDSEFNPLDLSMADFFPVGMLAQARPDLLGGVDDNAIIKAEAAKITQRQWCKFAINMVHLIEGIYEEKFNLLNGKGVINRSLSFLGSEKQKIAKFKMEHWFSTTLQMLKDQVSHWYDPNRPNMTFVDQVRMCAKSGMKMATYVPEMEKVIWSMVFAANVCVGANSPQERIRFACATMASCLDVISENGHASKTDFYDACLSSIGSMVRPKNWSNEIIPVVQSYLTMIPDVTESPKKTSFTRGMAPIVSYWIDFTTTPYDKVHVSMLRYAFLMAIENTKSDLFINHEYYFHPGSWIVERLGDRIPIVHEQSNGSAVDGIPVEQLPRD